jgi:hypothetical protein
MNWFRIKVLSVLFLCMVSWSKAQVFSLEPAYGLSGCQVHGDSFSGYDKLGIFTGAAVIGTLSAKTSFQLGFFFSQKGARHNPNPKNNDYNYYRLNLNYLELPLFLRYNVNDRYFLSAGPSFAYLINYKEDSNFLNTNGIFRNYEVGVNAGIGRYLQANWLIEVRTSNSITAVRKFGIPSNFYYPNPVARFFNKGFYNNIITFLVAYRMNFKARQSE